MSLYVLTALEIVYWCFVYCGLFEHHVWTNSNPDTWIHGCLATTGLMAVTWDWTIRYRAKRVAKEVKGNVQPSEL